MTDHLRTIFIRAAIWHGELDEADQYLAVHPELATGDIHTAVYYSPETDDNDAMKLLVETGKLTPENISLMLIRKHDWHDYDGVKPSGYPAADELLLS